MPFVQWMIQPFSSNSTLELQALSSGTAETQGGRGRNVSIEEEENQLRCRIENRTKDKRQTKGTSSFWTEYKKLSTGQYFSSFGRKAILSAAGKILLTHFVLTHYFGKCNNNSDFCKSSHF